MGLLSPFDDGIPGLIGRRRLLRRNENQSEVLEYLLEIGNWRGVGGDFELRWVGQLEAVSDGSL